MSVGAVNRDGVLAAIRAGCRTRDDLAERFEVLSSSRFLTDALNELGATVDGQGVLSGPLWLCGTCGLKPWDAPDLQPGEFVCTCHEPFGGPLS